MYCYVYVRKLYARDGNVLPPSTPQPPQQCLKSDFSEIPLSECYVEVFL